MGTCSSMETQGSIVNLIQRGDSAKAIMMMTEFQELFKAGSTVNSFGDTVLHYAAALGNMDIVRWLCSHNADVDAENSHGWTALDSAFFCSQKTVVQFLKLAGGKFKNFPENNE